MQLRQIEIDFDIHQMIELERRGFDEPPYVALRRLLKIPENKVLRNGANKNPPLEAVTVEGGRSFVEGGVDVPHGSLARMKYQRGTQVYEGKFLDGKLVVNGKTFDSLSRAARALAVTKDGTHPEELNGWLYWEAMFPGETSWKKLRDLREAARNRKLIKNIFG